jgi:Protein of unknown function (DUF2970)
MSLEPVSGTPPRPSLLRSMKVVAWSFLGIRKASESQQDMVRVSPFHIIGVGLALAAAFVVTLVLLVNWVVAK